MDLPLQKELYNQNANMDHFSILENLPSNCSIWGQRKFSQEVALFLIGMGMEKYLKLFQDENISFEIFLTLTDRDLESIGVFDPNDRKIITSSLQLKTGKSTLNLNADSSILPSNSLDYLVIAKNLLNHTVVLDNTLKHLLLKMESLKLSDYYVTQNYTANKVVHLIAHKAIQQTNCICNNLFQPEKDCGLINKILQKEKKELSTSLRKKLTIRRKLRRSILYVLSGVGICSVAMLLIPALRPVK